MSDDQFARDKAAVEKDLKTLKGLLERGASEALKPVAPSPEPKILVPEKHTMKAVVIGESSGATMEQVMAVFPRHKAVVDAFVARGDVIGIGPFADRGNMAIFRTRDAADAFSRQDPFILEGLVKSFVIRDWNDTMLT
jgi:uncharacterized protein YciI